MEASRRAEAVRLLGISQTLLYDKDFVGSRDFAGLSQETDPLLDGPDQILAVANVLIAADHRIGNRHLDWYAILQVDRRCNDLELIRRQYRRLALLLHPDKNQLAWADSAFRLVTEAWGVLSNAGKKAEFDAELGPQLGSFSRVDLTPVDNERGENHIVFGFQQFSRQGVNPPPQQPVLRPEAPPPAAAQFHRQVDNPTPQKQVSRRATPPLPAVAGSTSGGETGGETERETGVEAPRVTNFWTMCPYCYNLYQYPKKYIDCCLRCENCERAFHAAEIENLPPTVPGKDAYYCYWGFFPVGFSAGEVKDPPVPKKRGRPRKDPPENNK